MLEFLRPLWLLILLALPLIWFIALRFSYASLGPSQKWVSLAIRTIIWLLLVFSLAGAQFVRISDRVSVVVAVDASDSVDSSQVAGVITELEKSREEMKKDDSLGKVNFGADAYLEYLPQPGVDKEMLENWQTKPRGNFTDISKAIRLAVASFPANAQKRLVLVTDGNENVGNALAEARVARDNGVELVVVPLQSAATPEVILSDLEAPPQASLGETVNVRFVLDSTVATPATVSLIRNGQFVDKVPISVRPGKEVYEFPLTVDQSGFFTYELAVEPQIDTVMENNRAYTFSVVGGQPRLLYATGDPNEVKYLPPALRSHTINVDVVPPGGIPYSMEDFQQYDAVIFSDIAAYDVTDDQMKMIQVLVRDFGRGFMMVGGEKSFGPGGYFDTPIEEILPVDMDFRRKKITPSTLVVCLIDKSGSMGETVGGVSKVAMAKEACKAVVKLQTDRDYVGVMGFDSVGQWVVEPTTGMNKEATLNAISAMQAGGGTDLYPSLKAAWEASKKVPAQVKHFIVFTDGLVAPAPFEELTKQMMEDNITVSTVAFGTDADAPFLQQLAKMGGGNAYTANSLHDLPKIFTREVFMANKATLTEEPFQAVLAENHPLVASIAWSSSPMLYGYVATSAKDEAEVPLVTHKDDPLLAIWRYGLGKSVAFTSDAKNRWARDWLGWGGYEQFWSGVARWLRSDLDSSGVDVRTSLAGNQGLVQVSLVDKEGGFGNGGELNALITDPELESQTVQLTQTGPGEYEGRFPITANGNYFVNVVQTADDGQGQQVPVRAQASGLAVSYSPEYRNFRPDTFMLSQLQASSLAPEQLDLKKLFTQDRKPARRLEPAWELFTLLAICLWLFDIAARRLAVDTAEFKLLLAGVLGGAGGRRATAAAESLGGLMQVKARAQERMAHQRAVRSIKDAPQVKLDGGAVKPGTGASAPSPWAPPPPGSPPIAPPPAKPQAPQAQPGLSDLRTKLGERGTGAVAQTDWQQKLGPQPGAGAAEKPKQAAQDVSTREMTQRLLDRKRKDRHD
jgi:uncharacterized membrane protein